MQPKSLMDYQICWQIFVPKWPIEFRYVLMESKLVDSIHHVKWPDIFRQGADIAQLAKQSWDFHDKQLGQFGHNFSQQWMDHIVGASQFHSHPQRVVQILALTITDTIF